MTLESGKNDWTSLIKRGGNLKGINVNLVFTIIKVFSLNIQHIYWSHLISF